MVRLLSVFIDFPSLIYKMNMTPEVPPTLRLDDSVFNSLSGHNLGDHSPARADVRIYWNWVYTVSVK